MANEGTVAGQGPLLGWNKAQDAISELAKNVDALNKGLKSATDKLKNSSSGQFVSGWRSGGSGSTQGARGFGMLANDIWNNTSNYAHGRPNGGADAPATAPAAPGTPRAGSTGRSWARTANGGGSSFSGQSSQGGGASNNGGQQNAGGSGGGINTPRLGGGSSNNGGHAPYSFKSGLQGLYAWSTGKLHDQVVMQTAAYQASMGTNGGWSPLKNQMTVKNYTAYSTADAAQAYTNLASYGSSPGSSNFNTNWSWAKSAGFLDPSQSETQRTAGMAAAWTPGAYYGGQIIGVQTIKGGKGQNPRQIAQQVFNQYGGKDVKNRAQLQATFINQNSRVNQMLRQTLGNDLAHQVQIELTGMASAQLGGASFKEYDRTMTKALDGDNAARAKLKDWKIGGSNAQALLDYAGTKRNQDAAINDSFTSGLQTSVKYLDKFNTVLQKILKSTGADSVIGYTGGVTSMLGGAIGGGLGTLGMMRGLGQLGRLGGLFGRGGGLGGFGMGGAGGAGAAGEGGMISATAGADGAFGITSLGEGAAAAGGLGLLGSAGIIGLGGLAGWGIHHFGSKLVDKYVHGKTANKWSHVGVDAGAGAAVGAAVGSVVPVLGTAIGAGVGGAIGAGMGIYSNFFGGAGSGGSAAAAQGTGKSGAVATGTSGAGKTAAAVIRVAMKYLGVKYVWGGSTPKGFDCSGLMQWSFKQIGVSLPRVASQQQKAGKPVKMGQERAGDLMFVGNPAHHVVMCIGNGKLIEAPHTGSVVRIRSYKPGEFTNAVRILGAVGNMGDLTNSDDASNQAGGDTNRLSTMGFGGDVGNYGSIEESDAIAAGISAHGAASVGSGVGANQSSAKGNGDNGAVPGSMPTGNLKSWIKSALGILHQDTSANERYVNTMAMHESSGNPHAVNLTDSNAKAGHPSKGILQTIDPTFNAYSIKGHKDIWNPVDNIIAGVRYAESRYGSLANVPGIKSMANGGAYKGYAVGSTNIDVDQTARVHKGEMIIPAAQAEAMRKALASNTPLAGGLNTSAAKAAQLNFASGSVVIQVQGVMDQQSARDAAQQFMNALAEDNRINLIAAGN
ncbi:transglycosylase-like protein with SLT domain [Streptomyces sp. BK022]|uniref:NlpC/P60 family protein n=1 Tax=Streptomyces sp. BK022 TaxID=2512123 RepID=UPI0010E7BEEC|nr:NlpC/P60 family protein [Streptomyces sp. BK022]RZU35935.1 transglycosylase-like protein with SLT domain [Streptomyces sp. BK022]